ncbi:GerAB/ArcD/ProY family transporter [Priestia aryabhattai]|uniref:GerAB/ArcD/ProY family transporter n=1 Tax=Priestia megaterium TaxID=1404 RepID=UPI0039B9A52F
MLNKSKISPHQFRVLVILYSIGSTIIVVPAAMTAEAKQEAWLPYSLIIGLIYPLVLLVVGLFRKNYMSRMDSVS